MRRAVWALIEQGRLEPSVIALIRDEVRPCLSPGRAAALMGTVFELPTMPVGSAEQPVKSATAVPLAEPDVPTATQLPTKPFRLPTRPAPRRSRFCRRQRTSSDTLAGCRTELLHNARVDPIFSVISGACGRRRSG